MKCEQCNGDVAEADARTETHPGDVTLAFCPDCTTEGRR